MIYVHKYERYIYDIDKANQYTIDGICYKILCNVVIICIYSKLTLDRRNAKSGFGDVSGPAAGGLARRGGLLRGGLPEYVLGGLALEPGR